MKEKNPWRAVIEETGKNPEGNILYGLRAYGRDEVAVKGSFDNVVAAADIRFPGNEKKRHPRKAKCWLIV